MTWAILQGWKETKHRAVVQWSILDGSVCLKNHFCLSNRYIMSQICAGYVFSSISCSISEPFLILVWKKKLILFLWPKIYFSSLQKVELLYLFFSARNDHLNSEFIKLDLENNWVLELLAIESTGRTQFHPICSLISSSKTYLSIKT